MRDGRHTLLAATAELLKPQGRAQAEVVWKKKKARAKTMVVIVLRRLARWWYTSDNEEGLLGEHLE
jgi:uncharacterized protein (DUF2236 family)